MSYAIVINLDYLSHQKKDCNFVWNLIKKDMLNAGFILDKRLLVSKSTQNEACHVARNVIEQLNSSKKMQGVDVYSYLKDFYGYDHSDSVNLLLPDSDGFVVEVN